MPPNGAASKVLRRLGDAARVPPRGTGPHGAGPGGERWISASDVLVWNAKHSTDREGEAWRAADDPIRSRAFREDEIPLRDYQTEACDAAHDADVFRSGAIVMGCGDGKSRIAAELVRRSRAPAVILAPHSVCVDQWVELVREFVTDDVMTLSDARQEWRIHMPLPSVLVSTYHSLVRVTKQMRTHWEVLATPDGGGASPFVDEEVDDRLLMMLMCERFGLLVMDEVHVAVADYFISAGCLRASAVYGLSGSLVREDDRMSRLAQSVGPTLFTHFTQRNVQIEIVAVPMDDEHRARLRDASRRSKWEQAWRALNPYKVHALDVVLARHRLDRVIVFCDVMRVAEILHDHYPSSLLMTGKDDPPTRDRVLEAFHARCTMLVCTHVGDASINFPTGCVVVQFHVSSGSRQQEVQRCGRGTRDLSSLPTYMYHIVNADGDEATYVERRVAHLMGCMPSGVTLFRSRVDASAALTEAQRAMRDDVARLILRVRPRAKVHGRVKKMLTSHKAGHGRRSRGAATTAP